MVTELAEIHITPGTDAAFLAAVEQAAPLFQRARGCKSMRIAKRIEDADCYLLMVEWETVDDHLVHFRESAEYQEWRRLASPFFAQAPAVHHVAPVQQFF